MTWLLERVNELASGEVAHLSKATLDSAASIAEDFAMMRPILDTLLLSPVMPVQRSEGMQRSEGFCRALSAPLEQTTEVRGSYLQPCCASRHAAPAISSSFYAVYEATEVTGDAVYLCACTGLSQASAVLQALSCRDAESGPGSFASHRADTMGIDLQP